MRKEGTALALAGVLWLGGAAAAAPPDVAGDIRTAADALLRGTGATSESETFGSLARLVDAAARIGEEANLPEPARARIEAARTTVKRLSPLDERSRAAVAEAYAALNDGRFFEFPASVHSIEEAKAYGRGQVDRCLAALSAKRPQEAARELLGLVLLVATPMEAKP